MKTTNNIRRLCLALVALVMAATAFAQSNTISIGSAADWKTFCNRVNNGETKLNAKLTKNINLGSDIDMPGNWKYQYGGTFDGQGHTLTINWDFGNKSEVGIFQFVRDCNIVNLRTKGTLKASTSSVGGLIYYANGNINISGCVCDLQITNTLKRCNIAGMVDIINSGCNVTINDCLVKGNMTAVSDRLYKKISGFVMDNFGACTINNSLYTGTNNSDAAWTYTFGYEVTTNNCYYLNLCGEEAQGTQITAAQLKNGEVATLLQNGRSTQVWKQNVGIDDEPQPIVQVYCEISSKEDWKTFCDRINGGETDLDAKMLKDVDLGNNVWMAGDSSHPYSGIFDGQGHTLKFNWNVGAGSDIAPFKRISGATIKNLRTEGSITSSRYFLGGIVDEAYGKNTITGCASNVNITSTYADDRCGAGGMVSYIATNSRVDFTDCIVRGSIYAATDKGKTGMGGFVYGQNGTCTFTNCLYAGTNNANSSSEKINTFAHNATLTNCYYYKNCGRGQGTKATEEQINNGYVAAKLQGNRSDQVWGQAIGTDNYPDLTTDAAKKIYKVEFTRDGKVVATRYANKGKSVGKFLATIPARDVVGTGYNANHYYILSFDDGFTATTPVNDNMTVGMSFAEKDYYEIKSAADWKTFCELVNNAGQNGIDVKMTADVNIGSDIAKAGTYDIGYGGTFDGQNHTLTLNWNAYTSEVAPFRRVNGGTIKNLRTEGSITSSYYFLSGLIDEALGTINISNCVSNVNITSKANDLSRSAGLVNYIFTYAHVTINDCIVKGSINATTDKGKEGMGGFVYVQNGTLVMNNCLYIGENNATAGNTFSKNADIKNCYYLKTCGTVQGMKITAEQLKSGEVAYLLQGTREGTVWGQTLGTDIVPQLTTDAANRVHKVTFTYKSKEAAARYVNQGSSVGNLPTAQEILGAEYNDANTYKLIFGRNFSTATHISSDITVPVSVSVTENYEIGSKADWKKFCDRVNAGESTINAKLMNDVDLGEEITMAGASRDYNGIFDGQGHALTLNWNSTSGVIAPFKFVNNATIKNLRVEGKIKSDGRTLSTLVCNALGNVTLSGCVSDVDITSNYHGTGELAGMIAYIGDIAEVNIIDCIVKGEFNSTATVKKGMAGFVYLQTGLCRITNCLYAGTNNATAGSYTFVPGAIRKNCYYLNACGKAQDTKITSEQIANGAVAWMLQNGRSDMAWGQTIGIDAQPLPTTAADKRVYKVEFAYNNKLAATRYANAGGKVTLPTAKELLGTAYDATKIYKLAFSDDFSETTVVNGDTKVTVTVSITTGIDGVTGDDAIEANGAVYDLQGRRVATSLDEAKRRNLPAGVYIVNKRKVIFR